MDRAPSLTGKLDRQQRLQFDRNGYLCPLRALDAREVQRYLDRYLDYIAHHRASLDRLRPNEQYQLLSETHFVLPWVYEIISQPRILNAVESLLGPNLLAWSTAWFSKMPGEKTYVGWHQDGTYWNLRPPTIVTAWVALSPSISNNGCMRVIPGTHKRPMMPQRETYAADSALSRGQEVAVAVDEREAVDLSLRPGEMSLHHVWIVHGSNANNTLDTPRIGIAIRYAKPDVVQESPMKPLALLVRGHDNCGNFEILSPPKYGSPPERDERHKAIIHRIREGIMTTARRKPA